LADLNSALPWWLPLSILAFIGQMVFYHGVALAFEWCDRAGRLRAFKVRAADRLSYRELMPRVLANQFFVMLPAMALVQYAGLAFVGAPHIGAWHFLIALVLMGVGHDVVQYVSHRFLLHRPGLIRKLGHSVHHSTNASRSISACYMSAPDFFLEIVLPYLIPLILVGAGADIGFQLVVAGFGAFGGLYEHSGYDFSVRLPRRVAGFKGRLIDALAAVLTSKAHAEHHRRSNVSFSDGFGSPGLCDTAFSTRWDKVGDRGQPRAEAGRFSDKATR
jgi:sterol desaturase/sphingolipid hydroxylase (fatty acid hydroxylase superfamily)